MKRLLNLAVMVGFIAVSVIGSPGSAAANPYKNNILLQLEKSKQALQVSGKINACALPTRNSIPKPEVVVDTRHAGMSKVTEQMTAVLITNSTRWYFGNDYAAGERAINALRIWAKGNAHSSVLSNVKSASSPRWPTYELMLSSMNAMLLLDNHPDYDSKARKLIQSWVTKTLKDSYIFTNLPKGRAGTDDQSQRVNNHNARRALVLLYHGILTGNRGEISRSKRVMQRTINEIDLNGAFPRDAHRGDWALRYSNFSMDAAVMHLTLWIASNAGSASTVDLEKLNRAGYFLFTETKVPLLIHNYARKNVARGNKAYRGKQNNNWIDSQKFPSGSQWWAYVHTPIFKEKMPDAYDAARRALSNHPSWHKVGYSVTGGAIKCWFAN